VTTAGVLAVLLVALGGLEQTLRGLAVAAAVCGGLAALAFGVPNAVLAAVPAAVVGIAVYVTVLAVWRPSGLRHAWSYARALQ
jgi:hypothetical protein